MSVFDTLKDLQKATEKSSQGGVKRDFFTLKPMESFRIRFLQELAKDGDGYNDERGTTLIVPVHVSPFDFKKRLACTLEDEAFEFRCWAHEQVAGNGKWADKKHLLMNVAVLEGADDWKVKIFDQTFNQKHIAATLVEFALEYGSITDRDYKITRVGSGLETHYNLIPLEKKEEADTLKDAELYDLSTVYRKLPYDQQEDFFMKNDDAPKNPAASW